MLILTRRSQEAIVINENITVTVLSIRGNQVRLGIDAPRDIEVHREEIHLAIKKEKERGIAKNGDFPYPQTRPKDENFGNVKS